MRLPRKISRVTRSAMAHLNPRWNGKCGAESVISLPSGSYSICFTTLPTLFSITTGELLVMKDFGVWFGWWLEERGTAIRVSDIAIEELHQLAGQEVLSGDKLVS